MRLRTKTRPTPLYPTPPPDSTRPHVTLHHPTPPPSSPHPTQPTTPPPRFTAHHPSSNSTTQHILFSTSILVYFLRCCFVAFTGRHPPSTALTNLLTPPRSPRCDPSQSRRPWTKADDDAVRELVAQHGTRNWAVVEQHMVSAYGILGRSGKQSRERWHNHLSECQYVNSKIDFL